MSFETIDVVSQELSNALETGITLYAPYALGLGGAEDVVGLTARFVVGVMFLVAGYCKLFSPARTEIMYQTLVAARIPFARLNTYFVSFNELVFGFLFTIGALTLVSGLVLAAITLVALMTVGRHHIEKGGFMFTLSGYLYNSEVMILVMIGLVVFAGPGPLSVDAMLWPRLAG